MILQRKNGIVNFRDAKLIVLAHERKKRMDPTLPDIVSEEDRAKYSMKGKVPEGKKAEVDKYISPTPPPKASARLTKPEIAKLMVTAQQALKYQIGSTIHNIVYPVPTPSLTYEYDIMLGDKVPTDLVIRDEREKTGDYLIVPVSNKPVFTTVGHNPEFYQALQIPEIMKTHGEEVKKILQRAATHFSTSGSSRGLYNRLSKGLTKSVKPYDLSKFTDALGNVQIIAPEDIANRIVWKPERLRKYIQNRLPSQVKEDNTKFTSVEDFMVEAGCDPDSWDTCGVNGYGLGATAYGINVDADAGLPYPKSKRGSAEALSYAINLRDKLINIANSKTGYIDLQKYINERPEEFAVLMKNKFEVMSVDKMNTKTRGYFVYNSGLSWLFSCVMEFITKGIDPEESPILIGLSWSNGYAETMIRKILSMAKGSVMIKNYSDDGFIAGRTLDGTFYLITPDVSTLDLSLTNGHNAKNADFRAKVLAKIVPRKETEIEDEKDDLADPKLKVTQRLDRAAMNILRLNSLLATSGVIAIGDSECYYSEKMLRSGVPGTSWFGSIDVNNGLENSFRPLLEVCETIEDVEAAAIRAAKLLQDNYGLEIKEETLVVEKIPVEDGVIEDGWISKSTLLGQRFTLTNKTMSGKQQVVPIPDLEKLAVMFAVNNTQLSKGQDATAKKAINLSKCMSCCVSGGYHSDILYEACKYYWNKTLRDNPTLLPGYVDDYTMEYLVGTEDFEEQIQAATMTVNDVGDEVVCEFPERQFFRNLYLSKNEQIPTKPLPLTVGSTLVEGKTVELPVYDDGEEDFEAEIHVRKSVLPSKPQTVAPDLKVSEADVNTKVSKNDWADMYDDEDEEKENAVKALKATKAKKAINAGMVATTAVESEPPKEISLDVIGSVIKPKPADERHIGQIERQPGSLEKEAQRAKLRAELQRQKEDAAKARKEAQIMAEEKGKKSTKGIRKPQGTQSQPSDESRDPASKQTRRGKVHLTEEEAEEAENLPAKQAVKKAVKFSNEAQVLEDMMVGLDRKSQRYAVLRGMYEKAIEKQIQEELKIGGNQRSSHTTKKKNK